MKRLIPLLCAFAGTVAITGCEPPGKPDPADRWKAPTAVTDFETLYRSSCYACHSDGTNIAASISMKDPIYLAMLPEDVLRNVITNGVPGTAMPALAREKGGVLTAEQIDSLVKGIMDWKATHADKAPVPPYSAPLGDAVAGQATFGVYCASCHGADGTGVAGKAGSVVESAYLGLVTDQYLRSVTIAGRPELGCPNYRERVEGRVMTDAEIADVVAWLSTQRKPGPAEPPGIGDQN